MNHDKIDQTLRQLIKEKLDWHEDIPAGDIANFLDSMQLMALVIGVEDEFEIILEPEDEEQVKSYDDLIALISTKLST